MPELLETLIRKPPRVFVLQTRGPLILRDVQQLKVLATRTRLRVSFSLTTNRDDVRKLYEPLCSSVDERVATLAALRDTGIPTYATLAPLLPCDPTELARLALAFTDQDIIGDPFHVHAVKQYGATTRPEALRVSQVHQFDDWHLPDFQSQVVTTLHSTIQAAGRRFGIGPAAFRVAGSAITRGALTGRPKADIRGVDPSQELSLAVSMQTPVGLTYHRFFRGESHSQHAGRRPRSTIRFLLENGSCR